MTLVFERTRGLRRWRLRWHLLDERFWTRWGCRRFARKLGYRAAFIAQLDGDVLWFACGTGTPTNATRCLLAEILHRLESIDRRSGDTWRIVAILVLAFWVIAVGVFAGEWLWWHHAAAVAHEQLCRSFPSPACR